MLQTFKTFAALEQALGTLQPGHPYTTLSLDVYDTLIFRRCAPAAVLDASARWLANELHIILGVDAGDVFNGRHVSNAKVTAAKAATGLDPELNFTEQCRAWVAEYMLESHTAFEDLAMRLEAYEVDIERQVCYPNIPLLNTLIALKQRGFRLIFVSDMYLGHHVAAMLVEMGYGHLFEKGYVSGDITLLKRTGRLFDHVLQEEGIAAGKVLHIGDNPMNDGSRAVEKGINAFVIEDVEELQRTRGLVFDLHYSRIDPNWRGAAIAAFAQYPKYQKGSFGEAMGLASFGPLFAHFLHSTAERCKKMNIQNIFFMAREGSVLKEVFHHLAPLTYDDGVLPKTTYLAVSRLTSLRYAIDRLGLREIGKISSNNRNITFRRIFKMLKIDEKILHDAAMECGVIDLDQVIEVDLFSWSPFHRLLSHPAIEQATQKLKADYQPRVHEYLRQRGMFDDARAALIDVGWAAQIQESLYLGMKNEPARPQLFGYYLGVNMMAHWTKSATNAVEGVVADHAILNWLCHSILEFPALFEIPVRAPHGTTLDYETAPDGEVLPVFKAGSEPSRIAEAKDDHDIAALQRGIVEYAKHYKLAAALYNATPRDTACYARTVAERLERYPTKDEAAFILCMSNVFDLGQDDIYNVSDDIVGKNWWQLWPKLKRLLSQNQWRAAVFSLCGLRLLLPLWAAYLWVRRIRNKKYSTYFGCADIELMDEATYRAQIWRGPAVAAQSLMPQNYEKSLADYEFSLRDNCRQGKALYNLADLTRPLSLDMALFSRIGERIAQLASYLAHKHAPIYDRLPLKPRILRMIYIHFPRLSRYMAKRFGV